jgi:hypothetical protein
MLPELQQTQVTNSPEIHYAQRIAGRAGKESW